MTGKELNYVEDALGHEKYFKTKCNEAINQLTDPELKTLVQQMLTKHEKIYSNFYGLLG
ncbi:MAG: spore coat protein [Ruminococcus sp.]|nr:spore coat protein [Candidatus Apopatosoma intestinale]